MATIRKQPNGKYTAEVCVNGVRKSKTWDSKARAKSWAAEMEVELGQHSEGVSRTHTLGDVFARYAAEISEAKRGARWEIIRLAGFQNYALARVKLVDLKREHLEDWIRERLKTIKSSSVNRELNLISHCLTQARRWRLMSHNPMEDLQRPKNPPHRDRRITKGEIDMILAALGYSEEVPVMTQSQRVGVAFLLAIETAMRAGEICGIHAEHVNREERTVFLPETKNGMPRKVPLSSEALRLIDRLGEVEGGPLMRMKSGTLSTLFKRAVGMTPIKDLTFHDTRHEGTTRLAERFHVLDLARITGHRDIKMLQTYYNRSAADLAKMLD